MRRTGVDWFENEVAGWEKRWKTLNYTRKKSKFIIEKNQQLKSFNQEAKEPKKNLLFSN